MNTCLSTFFPSYSYITCACVDIELNYTFFFYVSFTSNIATLLDCLLFSLLFLVTVVIAINSSISFFKHFQGKQLNHRQINNNKKNTSRHRRDFKFEMICRRFVTFMEYIIIFFVLLSYASTHEIVGHYLFYSSNNTI